HRADLACGRRCRTRRQGARDRRQARRWRAACHPLDQIRAQQLAARGRTDLRHIAGARIPRILEPRREGRPCVPSREAQAELLARQSAVGSTPTLNPRLRSDIRAAVETPMIELTRYLHTTRIAYFSMEIGIRPEIHTYSGGLGVLAGDAARSAADLDLPMVFVTLASREGYLRQEIDCDVVQIDGADPWKPEEYTQPLGAIVSVEIEGRAVWIRTWLYELKSPLGRQLPIILLDANVAENDPRDGAITDRLYGGDEVDRIKQEIVLGIGGERMLRALGFGIRTYHL